MYKNAQKEELFLSLLEKTRELGRQAKFQEVEDDPNMCRANDFAYHFGSFTEAAEEAYRAYCREMKNGSLEAKVKVDFSKK